MSRLLLWHPYDVQTIVLPAIKTTKTQCSYVVHRFLENNSELINTITVFLLTSVCALERRPSPCLHCLQWIKGQYLCDLENVREQLGWQDKPRRAVLVCWTETNSQKPVYVCRLAILYFRGYRYLNWTKSLNKISKDEHHQHMNNQCLVHWRVWYEYCTKNRYPPTHVLPDETKEPRWGTSVRFGLQGPSHKYYNCHNSQSCPTAMLSCAGILN